MRGQPVASNNVNVSWITGFIWGIADDVLRDLYVRGKYRDVILPMTVLLRLDAILDATKPQVLAMRDNLDTAGVVHQEAALREAAGLPFYNTSKFSLKDLRNRSSQQQLRADFENWLDGFSSNVQDILENFEFRNQVPRLSKADALGLLIEKFLDPQLQLSSLDNHAMGTVFEELVRKFNEENNEEAGEHWTPRDVVKLMANLLFAPIADDITSGTYLLYDAAIGTGGMLTVAENTLRELAEGQGKQIATHLYGQEVNPETYAICKADLLLSGEGAEADNIIGGPEFSTISNDAFRSRTFDFMLSNPPYGKSWKTDLERMGGKGEISDPRFIVNHGDPEFSLLTRSSDGQMLFLANMVSKMKHDTPLGSRIAEVHSGSSLFNGDAGQGESNVRRYIIENDWLEAIIQLPENSFYNTGIATYIWIVTNRKPEHRKGKVQLIDASGWSTPLRKNLGAKNCELSVADLEKVLRTYLDFADTEQSKIFDNDAFGYRKIKVERPLRLRSQCSDELVGALRWASGDEGLRREIHALLGDSVFTDFQSAKALVESHLDALDADEDEASINAATRKRLLDGKRWARDFRLWGLGTRLAETLGTELFEDHNTFAVCVDAQLKGWNEKVSAADRKAILRTLSWVDPKAPMVVRRVSSADKVTPNPLFGQFAVDADGKTRTIEYEADAELADFERVPLEEAGGVESFMNREVIPFAPDAWVDAKYDKTGYEISFAQHFFRPTEQRSVAAIEDDIRRVLSESDGLVIAALEATG